jgi:hypothetical protein
MSAGESRSAASQPLPKVTQEELQAHLAEKDAAYRREPTMAKPQHPAATPSTALVLRERGIPYTSELKACQDALADIEVHIYEAWMFEKITKDAARHFLVIADICGWDMPWVKEMREWAS